MSAPNLGRRSVLGLVAVATAAVVVQQWSPWTTSHSSTTAIGPVAASSTPAPREAPWADVVSDRSPGGTSLEDVIAGLRVVDALPDVDGYDRGCGTEKKTGKREACVFGPAWTDDSAAPSAHNGCDTRNDVLGAQLTDVTFKPGTRDCKVVSGTLADPYTGAVIDFTSGRDTSAAVQIDHVFPLSRAWDAGAASWPLDRRTAFANDTALNLLAVDGPANNSKSDSGLDTWLPPNTAFGCDYATRYLTVADTYELAVTTGDVAAARTVCGSTPQGPSTATGEVG